MSRIARIATSFFEETLRRTRIAGSRE